MQLRYEWPRYLGAVSFVMGCGVGFGVADFKFGDTGWQWDAFGAFGAMSGLSLAAFALAIAFESTETGSKRLQLEGASIALWHLDLSIKLWLLPGVAALAHLFVPVDLVVRLMVVLAFAAVGQGVGTLLMLSAFLRLWTSPKKGPSDFHHR